ASRRSVFFLLYCPSRVSPYPPSLHDALPIFLATAVATSDSDYGRVAVGGANFAGQLLTLKYSRGAELEADHYGMQYMSRAGYDPDRKSTRLNSSHVKISYAVFCLKKKNKHGR